MAMRDMELGIGKGGHRTLIPVMKNKILIPIAIGMHFYLTLST
jgi:hypothetical protein